MGSNSPRGFHFSFIRRLASIMTSWVKISGSALFFVVLIGLGYGAPPLDVSEFFGTPAEAASTPPAPEAKSRMDTSSDLSELLAKLGGGKNNALRALATMLNPSHVDEKPDDDVDEFELLRGSRFGQGTGRHHN